MPCCSGSCNYHPQAWLTTLGQIRSSTLGGWVCAITVMKKMVERTSVVGFPASLSLFQGNDVPNFLSGTATTPFLAMQVNWEGLALSSKGGSLLSKATPWPQPLVQDRQATQVGQSEVRKHLLGPSEKEASCSSENSTRWYVLSSYCLHQGQAPGTTGGHLLTLRTASLRMEQIICVVHGTNGSCVMFSHWIKPCLKLDQSLDFQLAKIINSLYF